MRCQNIGYDALYRYDKNNGGPKFRKITKLQIGEQKFYDLLMNVGNSYKIM